MPSTLVPAPGTNLSVLVGSLSRPPEVRPLPSGDQVLALEVTVRPDGQPAESVPVAWLGAPVAASHWAAGEEVLVVGRVRRRFFRAGGATQSRTEVAATVAIPTRRATAAAKALQAAVEVISGRL